MLRLRRRRSPFRFLLWLIPIAVIGLVVFGLTRIFGAAPEENAPQTTATPSTDSISPVATEELAPDGFPVKPRQHVLIYTVQPGDALLLIAQRFGLSPNTIFWANTETLRDNVDLILVGARLYILPVDGVYHLSDGTKTYAQIAEIYGVTPDAILTSEFNRLPGATADSIAPNGLRLVVPGGQRAYQTWLSPFQTGGEGGLNPQGESHPGSCRERYTGAGGTGQYENPVHVPYRVTTGFEPWHPGVDLAADRDTPIYAADTGVVVFAGWHRVGYGNLIIIDHGGGWTTYYGHLAKRFVGCGDQVEQGQLIGLMGATGNASGIHLHFEVRSNDVPQNPYNFIQIHDMRDAQP